jgi:hypothetical protein
VVIDPMLLVRKMTPQCISEFLKLGSKVHWRIIDGFHSQTHCFLESGYIFQSLFTDVTLKSFCNEYDRFFDTVSVKSSGNYSSSYQLFLALSGDKVFATGNETEAIRHILSRRKGDILLVTDQEILLIRHHQFDKFRTMFCMMKPFEAKKIPDYAEAHQLYDSDKKAHPLGDILSSSGAEGPVLTSGDQLIKCYYGPVDTHLPEKLDALVHLFRELELQGLETEFAFPRKLLYLRKNSGFVGFLMDRLQYIASPDDVLCKYRFSRFERWQLALNLTSQVLFLHLRDIQPVDYNWNNFGVNKDLHLVFMDTDSYVVGNFGTKGQSPQPVCFQADFSKKEDLIRLDYLYLHAAVFFLLTNCRWPFTAPEHGKPSQYILNPKAGLNMDTDRLLQDLPLPLRHYFQDIMGQQQVRDPAELYYLLMRLRSFYEHGTVPDLKNYRDIMVTPQKPTCPIPPEKRSFFF